MERQPQNPEFRSNPENFHPCRKTVSFTAQPKRAGKATYTLSGSMINKTFLLLQEFPILMS